MDQMDHGSKNRHLRGTNELPQFSLPRSEYVHLISTIQIDLVLDTSITSHNYRLGRAVAAGGGVGGRGLGRGGGVVPGARPVWSEVSLALVQAAHLLQGEVGGPDLLHHLLAVCNKSIYKNMNSRFSLLDMFWTAISFHST